jgi:hypothetical protein
MEPMNDTGKINWRHIIDYYHENRCSLGTNFRTGRAIDNKLHKGDDLTDAIKDKISDLFSGAKKTE